MQRLERGKYGARSRRRSAQPPTIERKTSKTRTARVVVKKPKNPLAAGYDLDALGRVIVPDGVIVTACQNACPTQAITFGNLLDPNSKVSKQKAKESEYLLLGELNTKPRTSYLPRVRNTNPSVELTRPQFSGDP